MVHRRDVFAVLVVSCLVLPQTKAFAQGVSDPVADALNAVPAAVPTAPVAFVGITPCRLADTRTGSGFSGAFGPPSMAAQSPRLFPVAGNCGIPVTAQAVSANMAVTNTSGTGFISVWPGGDPQPNPLVASMNYSAGQTIANAVLAPLGNGGITVYARVGLDLIIDVNGYFDAGAAGPPGPTGPAGPTGPPGPPGIGACVDADLDTFFATPPLGACPSAVDCNDNNAFVRPGAPELCDTLDNDCNGAIDSLECGVGACHRVVDVCVSPACVPGAAAPEVCGDGIDNNCNGVTDEGVVIQPNIPSIVSALSVMVDPLRKGAVPASCGGSPATCCPGGNPVPDCGPFEVEVTGQSVLTTADPNRFPFTLRMRLRSLQGIPVNVPLVGDCVMSLDTAPGAVPYVEIRGDVLFRTPDPINPSPVLLTNVFVDHLGVEDVSLTGGFACQFANLGLGFYISTLEDAIADSFISALCP